MQSTKSEFRTSRQVTAQLIDVIRGQNTTRQQEFDLADVLVKQREVQVDLRKAKALEQHAKANDLVQQMPRDLQRAVELAQEFGASSWLTARPIQDHGFALHKSAFRDAVALLCGWEPQLLYQATALVVKLLTSPTLSRAGGAASLLADIMNCEISLRGCCLKSVMLYKLS